MLTRALLRYLTAVIFILDGNGEQGKMDEILKETGL